MRRAEIAVDALLHVAALLRADDQDLFAVKTRHAADDGGIVAEAAVAVNFAEVGKNALDVVESLGALRMPRQFGLLPCGGRSVHLLPQGIDALLQFRDLPPGRIVGAVRFHLRHLALDLLQFLLCFFGRLPCSAIS